MCEWLVQCYFSPKGGRAARRKFSAVCSHGGRCRQIIGDPLPWRRCEEENICEYTYIIDDIVQCLQNGKIYSTVAQLIYNHQIAINKKHHFRLAMIKAEPHSILTTFVSSEKMASSFAMRSNNSSTTSPSPPLDFATCPGCVSCHP
jgi:hypothetical protein